MNLMHIEKIYVEVTGSTIITLLDVSKVKGKSIPVTGRGGLYHCETLRLLYFLHNWLTDGGEVVSLTRQPLFTPRKIPGTHFC
jgi:hypothetical protein